ncbi:MAG TPA: hypothetical protein DD435_15740 [Cyanobacteria bacterium UBA8530]|nr:hypothetical protein [Cyanobacteria bacterium UBA8530]
MNPPQDFVIYQFGLAWSEAATVLTRVLNQGRTLVPEDRQRLIAALNSCLAARKELSDGTPVGTTIRRVTQPLYKKDSLNELLVQAEECLQLLSQSVNPVETVVLSRAKLAWLVEFLSDLCILLLREIATKSLTVSA